MLYIAHSYCPFDEEASEGIDFFASLEAAQQFKREVEEGCFGDIFVDIYEAKRISSP